MSVIVSIGKFVYVSVNVSINGSTCQKVTVGVSKCQHKSVRIRKCQCVSKWQYMSVGFCKCQ